MWTPVRIKQDKDNMSKWKRDEKARLKEGSGGVWTASNGLSTAAGTNDDNYHSNNVSLSEGMEGKDKWLCMCVGGQGSVRLCLSVWGGGRCKWKLAGTVEN
jgi:hypothetical protein